MKKRIGQNGFHLIMIPLIVIIIGIIGFAGWYVYKSNTNTNKSLDNVSANGPTKATPTASPTPSAWKTYNEDMHDITFEYPIDASVKDAISISREADWSRITGPNDSYYLDIIYSMGDKGGWVAERKIDYNYSVSNNQIVLGDKSSDHLLTDKERLDANAPGGYNYTIIEGYYIEARPLEYTAADAQKGVVAKIIMTGKPAEKADSVIPIFEHVVNSIKYN